MITKIDELINYLDPKMELCKCCNQWEKQINFLRVSSNLFPYFFKHLTCAEFYFCNNCCKKIYTVYENQHFVMESLEMVIKSRHYPHFYEPIKDSKIFAFFQHIVYDFKNIESVIEREKYIQKLKIQKINLSTFSTAMSQL